MLDLSDTLADALLARLNEPETLQHWQTLLTSEAYLEHQGREQTAYDTSFSDFHRQAQELIDEQLDALRHSLTSPYPVGYWLLGRWFSCVDVFSLSSAGPYSDAWVSERIGRRPLSAIRVGATICYLSGKGRSVWQKRRWQGQEDPLMSLPYQRKYDNERHGRADAQLKRYYEQLGVAHDLLGLLSERIEDLDIQDGFTWPEVDDIFTELQELDLGFGSDGLSAMIGAVCLELCTLTHERDRDGRRRVGHVIEDGRYRGALGGYHRRPTGALRPTLSPASQKWMLTRALAELRERLEQLLTPYEDVSDPDEVAVPLLDR